MKMRKEKASIKIPLKRILKFLNTEEPLGNSSKPLVSLFCWGPEMLLHRHPVSGSPAGKQAVLLGGENATCLNQLLIANFVKHMTNFLSFLHDF